MAASRLRRLRICFFPFLFLGGLRRKRRGLKLQVWVIQSTSETYSGTARSSVRARG